jgi:hypothetical protein
MRITLRHPLMGPRYLMCAQRSSRGGPSYPRGPWLAELVSYLSPRGPRGPFRLGSHLVGQWLSPPNGRPPPEVFTQRYGLVRVGERGGIQVPNMVLTEPLEPK